MWKVTICIHSEIELYALQILIIGQMFFYRGLKLLAATTKVFLALVLAKWNPIPPRLQGTQPNGFLSMLAKQQYLPCHIKWSNHNYFKSMPYKTFLKSYFLFNLNKSLTRPHFRPHRWIINGDPQKLPLKVVSKSIQISWFFAYPTPKSPAPLSRPCVTDQLSVPEKHKTMKSQRPKSALPYHTIPYHHNPWLEARDNSSHPFCCANNPIVYAFYAV